MRTLTYCLKGEELQANNSDKSNFHKLDVYRTASKSNLHILAYHLWAEDGDRDPQHLLLAAGTGIISIPISGVDAVTSTFPPTPVGNMQTLVLRTLDLPKRLPVRVWGTIWLSTEDGNGSY